MIGLNSKKCIGFVNDFSGCDLRDTNLAGNDKAPTASSQNPKEVDQVDIVAQDQGGQEFDPLASKAQGSETPESSSVRNEAASSKEEVVEDDQGGQDFEPLKAKRAVDWSEEKQWNLLIPGINWTCENILVWTAWEA